VVDARVNDACKWEAVVPSIATLETSCHPLHGGLTCAYGGSLVRL
jgi:hypothetical protein